MKKGESDCINGKLPLRTKDILLEKEMCYFNHYFEVPVTKELRFTHWYKSKVIEIDKCFYGGRDVINPDFISNINCI